MRIRRAGKSRPTARAMPGRIILIGQSENGVKGIAFGPVLLSSEGRPSPIGPGAPGYAFSSSLTRVIRMAI